MTEGAEKGPAVPETNVFPGINRIGESCIFRGVMGGAAGAVFGSLLGLFFSSTATDPVPLELRNANLPTSVKIKESFKAVGRTAVSMGKNFGAVGLVYGGIHCGVEKYRAKTDLQNSLFAGCLSGAVLACRAGPQGMAFGCAGFAAFSVAIDYFLEQH
eukprot:TRINITY_DN3177_c0_g1_i1.p1 TRINITY_DN3177_c0_g1~~TRINITY_DN3177_c0_g1_i1.p1  ORF type:complete len:158 (+),score=30.50 TRINITY_DN3177_c0_g1_i1:33-506(+)